jgi:cysteine-rich repeat protein
MSSKAFGLAVAVFAVVSACGSPGSNDGGTGGGSATGGGLATGGGSSTGGGSAVDAGLRLPDGGLQICGDGLVEGDEQCDDGNQRGLDGCDATCHFEVVARLTSLQILGGPSPAFCATPANAIGATAISGLALSQLNAPIADAIDGGLSNILVSFEGLADLTGVASPALKLGLMDGVPDAAKGVWPGAMASLDWWFTAANPYVLAGAVRDTVPGSLAARELTAGPGTLKLPMILGGVPTQLELRHVAIAASVDSSPAPSTPAAPPAHLAAGLKVFESLSATQATQGLCGAATVASLSKVAIPAQLAAGGSTACGSCAGSHQYTACANGVVDANCNSLLDLIVGGCKVISCQLTAVTATQPDVAATSTVPLVVLSLDPQTSKVVEPTDVDLDGYSISFSFTANRVHVTSQGCAVNADCQAGQTCSPANLCQ